MLGEDVRAFLTPRGVNLGGDMDTSVPVEPSSAASPDAGAESVETLTQGLFSRAKARWNPYSGA